MNLVYQNGGMCMAKRKTDSKNNSIKPQRYMILMAISPQGNGGIIEDKSETFTYAGSKVIQCNGRFEPIIRKCIQVDGCEDMEIVMITTDASQKKLSVKIENDTKDLTSEEYFVVKIYEEMFGKKLYIDNMYGPLYRWESDDVVKGVKHIIFTEEESLKRLCITSINVSDDDSMDTVMRIARYIRNVYKTSDKPDKLWINTYGAYRNLPVICGAVASLLRLEESDNIPDNVYGVRYGTKKEIISQSESFDMLQVVAGMEKLFKYGKADLLRTFFIEGERTETRVISKEDKETVSDILDVVEKINIKLRFCNVSGYRKVFGELKELLNKLENDMAKKNEFSILNIFVKYVRREFETFLCKSKISRIDLINWCIEKNMYQEAMNIVSAHMGRYMYEHHIIYYETSLIGDELNEADTSYLNKYLSMYFDSDIGNSKEETGAYIENCLSENVGNRDGQGRYYFEYRDRSVVWKSWYNAEDVINVLARHKIIKMFRDKLNYAASDRPEVVDVVRIMKEYTVYLNDLTKNENVYKKCK